MRIIAVALLLAGCSSGIPGSTDPVTAGLNTPPAPTKGVQIPFGPFQVAPGKEVQMCRTLKLSNDVPIAVNRLEVFMNTGSHHFIAFRSKLDYPDQTFPCWGTVNFDEWEFVVDVNKTGGVDWEMDEGQAFIMQPHQQIMLQSHYVNATTVQAPDGGMSYLNLHEVPINTIKRPVFGMFTVNTRIAVPPHETYTTTRDCTFSQGAHLVAMTGHFHARGTSFVVDHLANTGDGDTLSISELYRNDSWDSPLFKKFTTPPLIGAGVEGLRFSCSYMNETDTWLYFGGHADVQEHCNLFFHYYSDPGEQEPLRCMEGSGGW